MKPKRAFLHGENYLLGPQAAEMTRGPFSSGKRDSIGLTYRFKSFFKSTIHASFAK